MPVRHLSSPSVADTARTPTVPDGPGPLRPLPLPVGRTRAGAVWVGLCIGVLVLVALVVFMLQNRAPVDVTFLGLHGTAPLALMLLIAGLGVAIVALAVGSLRIGQLRHRSRRARTLAAPAPTAGS